jgi:hypothetical protein
LESGGILMVGGVNLCCDFFREGGFSFIGSGAVEQTSGGVEAKSQELKSKLNRLRIQCPLRKRFWKRADVSHRILTFWPQWHTTKGVTHLPSYGYGLKRRLSWVCLSRCVRPTL